MKENKYSGSSFDGFLKEEGIYEEVKTLAQKELASEQYKRYPIFIDKDPDSAYGVTVPDLPRCFTAGDTVEDLLKQAREAIECHLEGLLLYGDPIPEPKTIAYHQDNPDYADGQWEAVPVIIPTDASKIRMPQPNPIHRFFRWFSQVTEVLR